MSETKDFSVLQILKTLIWNNKLYFYISFKLKKKRSLVIWVDRKYDPSFFSEDLTFTDTFLFLE